MRALPGMSKADTLRLAEIETYIVTGKRADGLQVTDAWIAEALQFLVTHLRPTIDAWVEMGRQIDRYVPVVIATGKVRRAQKRGVGGAALGVLYKELDAALENEALLARQALDGSVETDA